MVIENREDVKNIIRMFFELVDAHYGMFFTDHIGEGDRLDPAEAALIKELCARYAPSYWDDHDDIVFE